MQIILHCPFLWSELLPHKSVLLPSQPLPQSSQASFVRLSRHLVHMASSLFWITAWRGFLCCSGMGTPVLVMSDSRFCLPKRPAALIRRPGQRGKQKPPEVGRARFQETGLPMWQDPDIWEVNSGLTLSLHSP